MPSSNTSNPILSSASLSLHPRTRFPNPVAVYHPRFLFTTFNPQEVPTHSSTSSSDLASAASHSVISELAASSSSVASAPSSSSSHSSSMDLVVKETGCATPAVVEVDSKIPLLSSSGSQTQDAANSTRRRTTRSRSVVITREGDGESQGRCGAPTGVAGSGNATGTIAASEDSGVETGDKPAFTSTSSNKGKPPMTPLVHRLHFDSSSSGLSIDLILSPYHLNSGADVDLHPSKKEQEEREEEDDEASMVKSRMWCFSLDKYLKYTPFDNDFGPLNVAKVYAFCLMMQDLFSDESLKNDVLCLYSDSAPEAKANAACLMALWMVLAENADPWDALEPIQEWEFRPFWHAGSGKTGFGLSIQSVVWGVWHAQQQNLLDLTDFDEAFYEYFEKPENGDLNMIGPFVAFASPVDPEYIFGKRTRAAVVLSPHRRLAAPRGPTDRDVAESKRRMNKVMKYFRKNEVKLIFRLNEDLYDREDFKSNGFNHVDMPFTDGSNPSHEFVERFIRTSDKIISSGGRVAVHCRAGLGRTGALMGAYFIYKYGFTAEHAIGFMRLLRPGMVVGPQQQWLQLNQATFLQMAAKDEMVRQMQMETPSFQKQAALGTGHTNTPSQKLAMPASLGGTFTPSKTPRSISGAADGLQTPGQPRKTPGGHTRIDENAAQPASPSRAGPNSVPKGSSTMIQMSPIHKRVAVSESAETPKASKIPRRTSSQTLRTPSGSRVLPRRALNMPSEADDIFGSSPTSRSVKSSA